MKKVWKNASVEELEIQATAKEFTAIIEFDGVERAADGSLTGYIVGHGEGSGMDSEVILHEKLQ